MISLLLSLCFAAVVYCQGPNSSDRYDSRIPLHLLNILPFPNGRSDSGWDRAYELIPAAQLAAEHINNATDVLPGYKLEVVTVKSESCGLSLITEGLVNSFSLVFDPKGSLNVVGLTGLFCSSVTDVIAPTFSFPKLTYLQVAGSTAPAHRNDSRFPWLVHLLSSSTVSNDAAIEMMNAYGWSNIGVVHDSLGIFFSSVAKDFLRRTSTIFNTISIPVTPTSIQESFSILLNLRIRIVLIITSVQESVRFMCEAYKHEAFYPGFVYIFQSRALSDFISSAQRYSDCNKDQIKKILEGVFLIDYNLTASSASVLPPRITYAEYYQEYLERLLEIESTLENRTLDRNNVFANSMYDEVWAFALALNASLEDILVEGIDLSALSIEKSQRFATIVKNSFSNLHFEGASGLVKFDQTLSDASRVSIYQVLNGTTRVIGLYDRDESSSIILDESISPPDEDQFETVVRTLPLWVFILFTVTTVLCAVLTSVLLLFILLFRNRPEIKASSPYLNIFIFLGCYGIFLGAEFRTVTRGINISSDIVFTLFCNGEVWFGNLGMVFIFATLTMRILRIRTIFRAYGKVSKYWGDGYLALCVILISTVAVVILAIWTGVDPFRRQVMTTYISSGRPPYFESRSICYSDNLGIWLTAAFSNLGIILGSVVFLAIQTRKVKLSYYKDTKKVNFFIFFTVLTLCTLMPLWFILENALELDIGAHFVITIAFILIGLLCQFFIFAPQVITALYNNTVVKRKKKKGIPIAKRRETQFAKL